MAIAQQVKSGENLGAELFVVGPMFTTEGGHGTAILNNIPEAIRPTVAPMLLRLPKTAGEARMQVAELHRQGVDGIKAILQSGSR